MGAFVVYIGLSFRWVFREMPMLRLSGVAVSVSVIAVFCSARIPTDWKCAVRKSIFGLFALTLGVVGSVRFAWPTGPRDAAITGTRESERRQEVFQRWDQCSPPAAAPLGLPVSRMKMPASTSTMPITAKVSLNPSTSACCFTALPSATIA